ncbi:MAG: DUF1273 domain-containing protein [Ruminococcus sp.]|jgi:uncharacterized phage-like protein YoqJ|nr:DUF1273 domain-containing protein [Ruminococcus sp.]
MKKTCFICGTPVLELPFGYDEEDELCTMIKLRISQIVSQLITVGVTEFITDCEFGVPLWGAEIVLAHKIFRPDVLLRTYLPYENQAAKWTPDWRRRYFDIQKNADDCVIYNNSGLCMQSLNDDADIVLYIGNDSNLRGGDLFIKKKIIYIIAI